MDLLVRYHLLAPLLPVLWAAGAFLHAGARASAHRPFLLGGGLALLLLCGYAAVAFAVTGFSAVRWAYWALLGLFAAGPLLRRLGRAAPGPGELLAAIGLARGPGERWRAGYPLAALGALSVGLLALGAQLRPCAPLDLRLGRSGCQAEYLLDIQERQLLGVALAPRGGLVALNADTAALLIDPRAAAPPRRLAPAAGRVVAMAWAPDGRRLALASDEPAIYLWELPGGAGPARLPIDWPAPERIAWAPDGASLALELEGRAARLDPAGGGLLEGGGARPAAAPLTLRTSFSASPHRSEARLLRSADGALLGRWVFPHEQLRGADVTPDGSLVAFLRWPEGAGIESLVVQLWRVPRP